MARGKKVALDDDRKHLIYTATLLAAVLAALLLGAALRADPESDPLGSALPSAVDGRDAGGAQTVQRAGVADLGGAEADDEPLEQGDRALGLPFHGDSDLADRAADDERRLQLSGSGFTLQFAVVCEPENARGSLEELAGRPRFYLLTTLLDDRVCFRLCWGIYDSERQARAAGDVPGTLRDITDRPKVLSIGEALP